MHLEFLVEDRSGEVTLDLLVPRIIGSDNTYKISPYRGIGRLPSGMKANGSAEHRILLDQLPRLLQGFGKTFEGYGAAFEAALVVVCDLDDKDLTAFLTELNGVLAKCNPRPRAAFCIAVEEGEAWFLGDRAAILAAFPDADDQVLNGYVFDSICGTWETLANAVYPGGSAELKKLGWQEIGRMKSEWARAICPHMDLSANNGSRSFLHFRTTVTDLVTS